MKQNLENVESLIDRKKQMIYLKKLPKKIKYQNLPFQQQFYPQNIKSQCIFLKQNVSVNIPLNQWSDNQSTAKNLAKSRIENNSTERKCQQVRSLCQNCFVNCQQDLKNRQNMVQGEENIENCCMRLFTFMGSTQKHKSNGNNDENQCKQAVINEEKNLLNFIENSRKKREDFLNQLKRLDQNESQFILNQQLKSNLKRNQNNRIRTDLNIKLRKRSDSTKSMKEKTRSSYLTLQNTDLNCTYFRTRKLSHNFINQNERRRKLSQKNIRKTSLNSHKNLLENKPIKKDIQQIKQIMKNQRSSVKSSRSNLAKNNLLVNNQQKFSNLSIKCKVLEAENKLVDIDKLMRRKRQLQKQLTNINDQLLLFNKKRKPNNKR